MFVDISALANSNLTNEKIIIRLVSDTKSDEFGLQTESSLPEIETFALVNERKVNQLDVSTGTYLTRVVYDFYVPTFIVMSNNLDGATLIRENGVEYVATSRPVERKYISHCVVQATERRF